MDPPWTDTFRWPRHNLFLLLLVECNIWTDNNRYSCNLNLFDALLIIVPTFSRFDWLLGELNIVGPSDVYLLAQ